MFPEFSYNLIPAKHLKFMNFDPSKKISNVRKYWKNFYVLKKSEIYF